MVPSFNLSTQDSDLPSMVNLGGCIFFTSLKMAQMHPHAVAVRVYLCLQNVINTKP